MAGYKFVYLNDREHVERCKDVSGILFLDDLNGIEKKIKDSNEWVHADYVTDNNDNRRDYYARKGGGLAIINRRTTENMPLFAIHLISYESKKHLKELTEELDSLYDEEKIRIED